MRRRTHKQTFLDHQLAASGVLRVLPDRLDALLEDTEGTDGLVVDLEGSVLRSRKNLAAKEKRKK